MVSVEVSWNKITNNFFINSQKTKVDQNSYIDLLKMMFTTLPYCLNVVDIIRAMTLNSCKTSAPSHHAKVTQQFLQQNTPDFTAADEGASCSPDLNPLD